MRSASLAQAGVWFAVSAWGASFVASRILLTPQVPGSAVLSPIVLAASRLIIGSLFFLPFLIRAIAARRLTAAHVWKMALLGQTMFTFYYWLQLVGVQLTSASIASILVVGLIPSVTAIIAWFVGREGFTPFKVVGLCAGFAGVLLIVVSGSVAGLAMNGQFLVGSLCLISNSLFWGFNSTMSKRWMREDALSPAVLTGGCMVFGAAGSTLLSLVLPSADGWANVLRLGTAGWVSLLFLAVVCSVVAFFLYNAALTVVPASQAAFYIYFEPVVAVALGVALLGEHLTAPVLAGAALLVLSAVVMNRVRAPSPAAVGGSALEG